MKIYISLLIGIILCFPIPSLFADSINLVRNGSFEEIDANSWAGGWTVWPAKTKPSGRIAIDKNVSCSGIASLRLSSAKLNSNIGALQVIKVKPNTKYIIKFKVRWENIKLAESGYGTFLFVGRNSRVESTFHSAGPRRQEGTNLSWREYQIGPFETGKLTAFTLLPLLKGAAGTVWYDDFRVYEVTEDMQDKIEQSRTRAILLNDLKIIASALKDSKLISQAENLRRKIQVANRLPVKFDRMKGPPICPEHRQVFALLANLLHKRYPKQDLIVRFANPFERQYYLTPVVPYGLGTDAKIAGLRNDIEQIAINLTNTTDKDITAKISMTGIFEHKWRKVIPVELKPGVFIDDALPLAETEGNWAIIDIPSGMTRQVWLELKTGNKPGKFSEKITIVWKGKPHKLRLTVKVSDLSFPKHWPIYTFCYSYLASRDVTKNRVEQAAEDLRKHHINAIMLQPWSEMPQPIFDQAGNLVGIDWTKFDRIITLRGKDIEKYIMYPGRMWRKQVFPTKLNSLKWQKLFVDYVRRVMDGLEKRGIKKEQVLWSPVDEPHGPFADEVVIVGKALHKADPNIRVYCNFYNTATFADIRKMNEVVDVWAPSFDCLNKKYLSIIKGKELWAYRVSGKELTPKDIRAAFAKLACVGVRGYSFWTYTDKSADPWDPYDIARHDYHVVYPGDNRELIPSKRWEAWREGVEDYTYKHILRKITGR